MAENDDGQEKTEQPSPKRLQDARRKGQVARSRELSSFAVLLGAAVALLGFGASLAEQVSLIVQDFFTLERKDIFDPQYMLAALKLAGGEAIMQLLPVFLVIFVAAVAGSVAIGGLGISAEAIQPKLSKMDPIKGIKRMFSANSLMELAKTVAKFLLVGAFGVITLMLLIDDIVQLMVQSLPQSVKQSLDIVLFTFLLVSASLIIVVLIDVPFQIWNHTRQLKMTLQEVKDENKDTEGRPEVKARIRQQQQQMSRKRMMDAVPQADVVVTNPTHYAVALQYKHGEQAAPVVLAKGVDFVAEQIRKVANGHEVPIISAPPLARSLYFFCEVEREVPADLFMAVAQVLAYVYQLNKYQKKGGARPKLPKDIPIPADYQRDA